MREESIQSRSFPTIIMLCRYHRGPVPGWAPTGGQAWLPPEMVFLPNTHLVRSSGDGSLVLFLDPMGNFTRVDLFSPAATVWALLDGKRSVAEVVADSPLDAAETLQLLAGLQACWAIRPAGSKGSACDP